MEMYSDLDHQIKIIRDRKTVLLKYSQYRVTKIGTREWIK